MSDPAAIAREVLEGLGGRPNVATVRHCMTRLRVGVHDVAAVDEERLDSVPEVLGVLRAPTTQVVLGPGLVDEVAAAFDGLLAGDGPEPASGDGHAVGIRADTEGPVRTLLRRIATIFLPLIPALVGSGVVAGLTGILAELVRRGATPEAAWLVAPLGVVSSAVLAIIVVLVGMNSAAEFGGTPVLGAAAAAVIPFAGTSHLGVFGHQLVPGEGGVPAALAAGALTAVVERWTRRRCPRSLAPILVPSATLLASGLATLYVFVVPGAWLSEWLVRVVDVLLRHGGPLAGAALGGLFLPLVLVGLHQALIPVHVTLVAATGSTLLLPVVSMAGAGQVGAAAALALRSPAGSDVRRTVRAALPAAVLGVGEPLVYGVTLPHGRAFVTACVGGACGGAFVGLFDLWGTTVGSTAIGPSGWALLPLVTGSRGIVPAAAVYAGGLVVAHLTGFAATWLAILSRRTR